MENQKQKAKFLEPCSSEKAEMKNEFELGNKVELINECSQSMVGEVKDEGIAINLCGIPLSQTCQTTKAGVTFVLEKASLSLAYVGRRYQILSSDEHADYLRKKNLNPYNYRPDIVHEALLQIMDSRLRMSGRLKAVYIRTDEGILIQIERNAHIPRTLGSFCSMMAQLLQNLSIKAVGKRRKLLRVVDNPITKHLPPSTRFVGLSFSSQKAVALREYVDGISSNEEFAFVVGAMAHGKIESDYIEDLISVSSYHLSSGVSLRRICIALERKWSIL